ncbi:MAG: hypothetical protein AB7L65_10740 [Hyphomonadaceae bacterium]
MIGGVRAILAAALMLAARQQAKLRQPPPAIVETCPGEMLARLAAAPARAALVVSLWAPGRRCLVAAAYPPQPEEQIRAPKARVQRANGHWARLSAAGYVFAETAAAEAARAAPVVQISASRARKQAA